MNWPKKKSIKLAIPPQSFQPSLFPCEENVFKASIQKKHVKKDQGDEGQAIHFLKEHRTLKHKTL